MGINKKEWLLTEYKLLSQHYFHEDSQFKKTIVLFITINTTLLGVYSSGILKIETKLIIFFPIIGIIMSFAWIVSMVRIREIRNSVYYRIKEIEKYIHSKFESDKFAIFDTKLYNHVNINIYNWPLYLPYNFFKRIPASLTYLILPFTFILIWIWILVFD